MPASLAKPLKEWSFLYGARGCCTFRKGLVAWSCYVLSRYSSMLHRTGRGNALAYIAVPLSACMTVLLLGRSVERHHEVSCPSLCR